ncbi:MAG TPA: YbhB/YbcL family Raf kinase inhibitor-like protein [Spirillospora sp.]
MTLSSPAFADGAAIPAIHARESGNVSPPLRWSGVPAACRELALTCVDHDAPGGSFVHWMAAGLPLEEDGIAADEERPSIARGRNDFGELGYTGPHPPPGDPPHRYVFTLYALLWPVTLTSGFTMDDLRAAVKDDVITTATLVGTYSR